MPKVISTQSPAHVRRAFRRRLHCMARELTLRIIIEQPPQGVDFGLQKGSGSVYETVQKQRSQGKDLVFEFQPSIRDGLYRPLREDTKTLLDNGTVYSS